jgi:hypothetical protein
MRNIRPSTVIDSILFFFLLSPFPKPAVAEFVLGPVEYVESDSGQIEASGYSIPSFTFWDGDSLRDLIVGEGATTVLPGKVRIYSNIGTKTEPRFGDFFYAQSEGTDLVILSGG